MSKKIPDGQLLDTKTITPSGKKMLYDKDLSEEIRKRNNKRLNENMDLI